MYQKRKARKEQNSNKEVEENNGKMNINCLTTVFPILLKTPVK